MGKKTGAKMTFLKTFFKKIEKILSALDKTESIML